jgi:endonuclease G
MARRSSSDSGGFIFKTGLFALLAGISFWIFNRSANHKNEPDKTADVRIEIPDSLSQTPVHTESADGASTVPNEILPSPTDALVSHTYFVLNYSEDDEQAQWVAYVLTREHLNENWAERPNSFRPDPEVHTESATPRDYISSGYDKGHLCPAADMAFDAAAIDESFFMSNMSPQVPGFNGGIWRELEELTRDWARRFKRLYVVTGPVLTRPNLGQIGFSKVTVPAAYYKVLLAPDSDKAIAFILPNAASDRSVLDYACNIDKVEKETGIDFFPKILKGMDEELEASLDLEAWPINRQRYEKRVSEWNRR